MALPASAYFVPQAALDEISWTFPISPGGFIGGMDVGRSIAGVPVIAFSESGTLYEMRSGARTVLHAASSPVFSSFVAADPMRSRYIHAESSGGGILETPVNGGASSDLGAVPLAYDAAIDDAGRIFVTRAGSFAGPSQVCEYDPFSQTLNPIAEFPGPTGPLAMDAGGNLYYGTASAQFGQVGGQTIYRISASQVDAVLAGSAPLSPSELAVMAADIDSPSDLLALPDGRLLFSSSVRAPGSIWQVTSSGVSAFAQLESSSLFLTNLAEFEGSVFVNVGGVYGPNWQPYGVIVQLVPEPGSLISLASLTACSLLALACRRAG